MFCDLTKVTSYISVTLCRWISWKSQKISKAPYRHNPWSIIPEKMPWLLPLPTKTAQNGNIKFSSSFLCYKLTWISIFSHKATDLIWGALKYVSIVTGPLSHCITPPSVHELSFPLSMYSYFKVCQGLEVARGPRSKGKKLLGWVAHGCPSHPVSWHFGQDSSSLSCVNTGNHSYSPAKAATSFLSLLAQLSAISIWLSAIFSLAFSSYFYPSCRNRDSHKTSFDSFCAGGKM